eukprot:SAG22_NODE_3105_length_1938_cov_1.647635_2_plen_47_part_01
MISRHSTTHQQPNGADGSHDAARLRRPDGFPDPGGGARAVTGTLVAR